MKEEIAPLKKPTDLRAQAEEALQDRILHELSNGDMKKLVHELQVHQIELEMQNEELRMTQRDLEESRNGYSDLYDFAPVGYFTFDRNGLILEVNLTGASKLDTERSTLIKKPFYHYVAPESRDALFLHLRQVFETSVLQTCELKIVSKSGNWFYARLVSLAVRDSEGKPCLCRTAISDITERKLAEKAISESEEKFRTSIENMLDAFGIYSAVRDQSGSIIDFKVEYVNAAACESNMMTPEEQIGRGLLELLPGHRESGLFDEYCRVVETGKPLIRDSLVYGDVYGRQRVRKAFDIRATKLGDGFVASWRDVTEKMLAREALQKAHDELETRVKERTAELGRINLELGESEQKYRNLFDNAGDAIITTDLDAVVTSWNRSAEKVFGWIAGETIGRKLDELIAPGDMQAEFKRNVRDYIAGKNITGITTVRQRKDGSRVDVSLTISAIKSAEGKITGLCGIFRDITKLKRAEEVLRKEHDELELRVRERTEEWEEANIKLKAEITEHRRAEVRIREQATLIEKAHDAIAVRDLENRLIYWNKSAERLYGWTKEEALGKDADKLLYKEETPQLISAKKNAIENGEWVGELHQLTKDGKGLTVESRWTLMRSCQGKPKSILIINTDITERKLLEAKFLRAQRMESIGRLSGGIAHDLNNMMTPIMLSLQMLREKLTDEKGQRLIDILERNVQRSADLIKQVLSFSRGVEGERKTLQVGYLISEIEKIAKEIFPRSIEITTDIPPDLCSVSGDATQLHQVLMNLCVNARDAMPDGGILSLSAGNVRIDEKFSYSNIDARAGPYTVIMVSDTGTGIPPEILDKIFEPFFTTKELGKGTGLGLSTSLTIVKSHGGFIDVQSKVGAGTTFKVYLPAIKAGTQKEEPDPGMRSKESSGKGETILVIDDEAPIRETTSTMLQTNGYRVITASDGVEAISLYAQNRDEVRVALVDMMMPIMDGPACIRALRQINSGIKIIAVSGETDRFSKIPERVDVFLSKPYTAEMLLKTLHEI